MQKLLNGELFLKILETYHCQDNVLQYVTGVIMNQEKASEGTSKVLISIIDCRDRFTIKRFPVLYFDAVFQYRFIPARKIVLPGETPGQDTLKIVAVAAEELTKEQFEQKAEEKKGSEMLHEAKNIINPKKDG